MHEKRMNINEIIFIRTKLQKSLEMPAYEYGPLAYTSSVFSVCLDSRVCLSYKPYTSEYAQK